MVNYANSKVYKIWSTQGDEIYIGSTTKQYLSQRIDNHRRSYRAWKNKTYHFVSSFKLFDQYGENNCFIELLEAKLCSSKDELKQLEGKHIRAQECVNKRIEGRTKKEYYDDNKEVISEKGKHYREKNKEKIKQYREENKEKLLEGMKKYREENRIALLEKKKEKFSCECGGKYIRSGKLVHFKTIKHCQFIESKLTKPEDDEV
jgi:adenylate kinase family enzyme